MRRRFRRISSIFLAQEVVDAPSMGTLKVRLEDSEHLLEL